MNTSLTFEVLLYLNSYYFGLFSVCEIGINIVKAINLTLPNIWTDFGILMAICGLELIRVVLGRKGNLTESNWTVLIAILLTLPSIMGVFYFMLWQSLVLRLEYIMCTIQLCFQTAEVVFGVLCLLPICKKTEY
ncbi:transmembrane protein 216-like [Agrilus planipennis]|uniref:Transmembrane protein 216-like n=1 Tax=Agrilus planipennis TaxID=224129 RepID=A0A1W4WW33_AGRPL|nr:transmembrane protein 216-like [Agrilus planipennis]